MTARPAICTEQDIETLVHSFYARVRHDDLLGPIFNSRVQDWNRHLATLVDFWSSVLLGTARFRGAPMPVHTAIPDLNPALFQRWLTLFRATTASLDNPAMQERANMLAQRIAESLWYGYQMKNHGDNDASLPSTLTTA